MLYVAEKDHELAGGYEIREATMSDYANHISEDTIIVLAQQILKKRFIDTDPLTSPQQMAQYLSTKLGCSDVEQFGVVYLNSNHQVIDEEIVCTGTIDAAAVYPREVVKACLAKEAKALIFYHNHPGGKLEASPSDRRITRRLTDALNTVDIRVLDHFIVTANGHYSFAEHGIM